MHFITISFRPLHLPKYWSKCQQATALDLPFYDISAPQKVAFLKISDDVIASDVVWAPPIKNPGYAYDWHYSIFFYQSKQQTVLNVICFLLSTLIANMTMILIKFQQNFALIGVLNILPLNFWTKKDFSHA